MPVRRFWAMESCISRIEAVSELKALQVAAHSQSTEGVTHLSQALSQQIGSTVVRKEKLDKEGLHALASQNTAK